MREGGGIVAPAARSVKVAGEVTLSWKKTLLVSIAPWLVSGIVRAQSIAVGASVGLVNDVSNTLTLDGFKHSEVTAWVDYEFERRAVVRATFGSMRTAQSQAGQTVTAPDGGLLTIPSNFKERVNYLTIDASYLLFEGWFTSGLFGGIGGYHVIPDTLPPPYTAYQDLNQTVFGFNVGSEAYFRVFKNVAIVGRVTYHNVSANPHRQFLNADVGLEARF